ncbi:MAG: TonB-dependent receptor, partial [Chthoniobacterales bacterium]|nr:TonB-dependent receptor [Chthoniobacterales bacterium]
MGSPESVFLALLLTVAQVCSAQEGTRAKLYDDETKPAAETEEIVVTATRLPISEGTSPAAISVVTSEEFEERQARRVADALRDVPGVSVTQTGAPGQLTSVFTRGLRSEHTQVLLDGIPINQGLQGAFNFADLTVDNIDRIEVVRGPQSTLYGPRALAGVIQIFTRQG